MRRPSWDSVETRFVDGDEVLALAREAAARLRSRHPEVVRVLLFGSFARKDYGVRSDLDLLLVLRDSDKPMRERLADYADDLPAHPVDLLPYTQAELDARLAAGDPFINRVLADAIEL